MRTAVLFAALVALGLGVTATRAEDKGDKKVPAALNFKMKSLDGKDVDLSQYQGKVVLFVNVASKCGYTKQYKGLEALHEKYADKGLVIIGVPANDFGGQEPGSDEEIAKFCSATYGVKFPMLAKVSTVKGNDKVPLYAYLTSKEANEKTAGEIKWNFTKFLINRKGELVSRFEPKDDPASADFSKAIEAELEKK